MKNKLIALFACSLLAACGTEKKDEKAAEAQPQDQGVNVQTTADDETAKSLPTMILAKVPVDANGNELVEQGEAVEVFGVTSATDGASADTAFAQGTKVTIADELDRETSSAQYNNSYYWNTPWYPGKLLGRGLWWGRNPYAYRGGNSYGYRYTSYYRYNNCNYYSYYPNYNSYGYDSYGY